MNDQQRLRKDDPERTSPVRHWSKLYRRDESWGAQAAPTESSSAQSTMSNGATSETIAQGVKLGYQVIEEHIRQGQRIAQQFNNRSYNLNSVGSDVRELTERVIRDSTNLLSLWFNLMTSLAGKVDVSRQCSYPSPTSSPPNGASTQKTSTIEEPLKQSTAVSIELLASGPTQVTLNLSPKAERLFLASPGLHAMNADKPPLTDLTFLPPHDGGVACLRIRVPDQQPPDLYTGVLVDRNTGLPQGTLSVRVLPSITRGADV
jgi:hypothetical protein